MITTLAGGVGAARMLSGVVAIVDPASVTAVVNTADDVVVHGLHVSPDLDTVTYTLAGAISQERGWGLEAETWAVMEALDRYGAETWFRLGDRDLATHLYRSERLRGGSALSEVTRDIAQAWGVRVRLLPMSDDRVETRVTVDGEGEVGFQEYFVARRHAVRISDVRFDGVDAAVPAPGVLAAIADADRILVCPSNPIVSIGPIVAIEAIRDAVTARRDETVAVSPIVAGQALKGPADRMLAELGHEPSVVGVARLYSSFVSTLVIDEADRARRADVEAEGVRCVVAPTVMHGADEAARLAEVALTA